MNVFIRADASYEIGTGHVMRCLTLADHLKNKGFHVVFIARELTGNLCQYIETKGFQVQCIPGKDQGEFNWEEDVNHTISIIRKYPKPRFILMDHYQIDQKWETKIRPYVKKIMVIDDLANRSHDCDLLLDQNLYEDMETRYDGIVPISCNIFLGPKYALLRDEFIEARKSVSIRNGPINRIMVFFGGSDPTNETLKVLNAIETMGLKKIEIDVVVGKSNVQKQLIENLCNQQENMNYYCQIENMAKLMSKADLAIGAGGSTTWERCYLGLPAVTIIVAENQDLTTRAVEKTGAILNVGYSFEVSQHDIIRALEKIMQQPSMLLEMSEKALKVVEQSSFIDTLIHQWIEE